MKIISYNIHKGFNSFNRSYVLENIRNLIQSEDADIVCLQEVIGTHQKIDEIQFEYLADGVWPHYAYGKNAIYPKGHHGNAILSRYPFLEQHNLNVSMSRLEQRGILYGTLIVPDTQQHIHIVCVHFGLLERFRQGQTRHLCNLINTWAKPGQPLIIAGDFNDWQQRITPVLEHELGVEEAFNLQHGKHAKTYPASHPIFCLDRIYVRGFTVQEAKIKTTSQQFSDHAALMATLL